MKKSIRPFSKPSSSEEFQGAYGAQNRSVYEIHEDSSTGATQKLPEERRFGKRSIINTPKSEFELFLKERNIQRFRADQIYSWIYKHGKTSFFDMSNIGAALQKELDNEFYIYRPKTVSILRSIDGTIKFLFELDDGNTVETVYIPAAKRNTICVSSQVGCPVGCKFCNTGYNGFVRNLSVEEIVAQYLAVNDYLESAENVVSSDCDMQSVPNFTVTNIVFMGMGEPLFNTQNVLMAIDIFAEFISRRKITLSTSGIVNVLSEISPTLKCKLAVSLHAPNDSIRSSIMPINDTYNIEKLMKACDIYYQNHRFLKITFEYLMLDGINDSEDCAYELVDLLSNLNAKVNILTFNSWSGCSFRPSSKQSIRKFASILEENDIEAPIRDSRGTDIMAACGQLQQQAMEKDM